MVRVVLNLWLFAVGHLFPHVGKVLEIYVAVFIKILEFKGLSFSPSVLTRVAPFPPRVLTLFVFIVWLARDLGL